MLKTMTHTEMSEKKHELLDLLVLLGDRMPPGVLFHLRDLFLEKPDVWLSWKKVNMPVVLWIGKMYNKYLGRKAIFKGLDPNPNDGAAVYVNP